MTSRAGNVAGILLAAGDGSRLGQPKALVVLGGQSLARRGVTLLHSGGANPVIVVTGAAAVDPADLADTAAGADGPSVISVHNPRWQTGMGSSLAVGLEAVPDDCPAAVVALADQPLVGPAAVRRLIAAHAAGAGVAVACYHGQPRNPVLISRQHWAEVADLATGDTGARPFLRAHPDLVTRIECADTGQPDDIDTREDLARVAAVLGSAAPFRP
ncbi:MAG TPA: nucleotidyltransferase family protein [Streptosporangiaceae bacterium]|nr:nucleotidyltransferase family protein [Streptosporangiaceae bacterium]